MESSSTEINRQAVVVIHGMGEQKPMDTLRDFVNGIKSYLEQTDESEKHTVLRSKPDGVSEIYETRKISLSSSRNRPITDFYEFYWAHNMRDTSFTHVTKWLLHLLLKPVTTIPPRLKGLWYTVWIFLVVCVAVTALVFFYSGFSWIKTAIAGIAAIPLVITIISFVEKYFTRLFLTTAGDAARYFSPTPSNIGERNNIRLQGISFLKKLHGIVDKKQYDRIIIVAHSLGTAIAYDLLRLLWTEYNETETAQLTGDTAVLKQLHATMEHMDEYCNDVTKISNDAASFHALQNQLWQYYRAAGNAWKITDFITIGAAVCSADYFFINKLPFDELAKQREFPLCPPVPDAKDKSISFPYDYITAAQEKRSTRILHHAALFAITRWVNIYYKSDYVGSKAGRLFGAGVQDIELPKSSLWFLPGGHTNYWDATSIEALAAITKAMQLRTDTKKLN